MSFSLAAIAATLTAAPAPAAFCGVPDDINPVVKLTIAKYPAISHANDAIDESYIRIVDVNGTYAYSLTDDGAHRIRFYWEKPTGTWGFVGANREPADWPKPLPGFFEGDDKALSSALPSCNNPNWKKRN